MSENVKRVDKPWGYELHWAKTDRYVGKLIHVNAGHALSLQYHNQKDETIFLWSGRMMFEIQERTDELVAARDEARGVRARHARHRPSHDRDHRLRHLRGLDAGAGRRRAAGGPLRADSADGSRVAVSTTDMTIPATQPEHRRSCAPHGRPPPQFLRGRRRRSRHNPRKYRHRRCGGALERIDRMGSVNKVILVGNLGRDAELRYTPGGAAGRDAQPRDDRSLERQGRAEAGEDGVAPRRAVGQVGRVAQRVPGEGQADLRRGTAADPPVGRQGRQQALHHRDPR